MIRLRSAVFVALAVLWTATLGVFFVPLLALPRKRFQRAAGLWCRGLLALVGACCDLRWRLVGAEHLPKGPALIAAKHQSVWETLVFHVLLDDPVYVLKQELLSIPVVGWYLRKAGMIAIDRSAGARAIRSMLPAAECAIAEGAQVIVFPEGTRTPPGRRRRYQPGIAALYERFDVPLIPVAVNSGLFWGRERFLRFPGTITLEVLPPMPRGLPRAEVLAELERRIEGATERLVADGGGLPVAQPVSPARRTAAPRGGGDA